MKTRYILYLIIYIASGIHVQAQNSPSPRQILDRTVALFSHKQSIKMQFDLTASPNGRAADKVKGSIVLQDDKFLLDLPSGTTLFDGHTQWTYLPANQEITVSNPTPEELENIHPYMFLQGYHQKYNYRKDKVTTYKNKKIHAIELQAKNAQDNLSRVTLYVEAKTYQPVYLKLTDKHQNNSEIEVISTEKGLNLPNDYFRLDTQKYPQAEVIDLR